MNPFFKFGLAGILTVALGTGFVIGCGGGAGGPDNSSTPNTEAPAVSSATEDLRGSIRIDIAWPPRPEGNVPRLIPKASESIKIEIQRNSQTLPGASRTVNRPFNTVPTQGGAFQTTGALFERLPLGALRVVATAYPEVGAKGNPQAIGSSTLQTVIGQVTQATITMDSTIIELKIVFDPAGLVVGESGKATATALDKLGRIVLTRQPDVFWSSIVNAAGESGVRLSTQTPFVDMDKVNITALRLGTWTIKARMRREDGFGFVHAESTISVSCPNPQRRADGSCAEPTPTPTPAGSCPGGSQPDPNLMKAPGCNGCDSLGPQCPVPPQFAGSPAIFWRYDCQTGECIFLGPK